MLSNKELSINYDDKHKYNKCKLINEDTNYILYLYFGISSTSLLNEVNYNTTYNLYFGKTINKKTKLLDNSITFKLIDKVNHFFNASLEGNNNYIYNVDDGINNYLYICFGAGRPMFYDTTQELDDYIYTDRKKCIKCINSLHYKYSHFLLFYIFFNLKIYTSYILRAK